MFNAQQFIKSTVSGASSTRYAVIPEGDYSLMLDQRNLDVEKWFTEQTASKGPNAGNTFITCEVPVEIVDQTLRDKMGQEHVYSRYRFIVDTNAAGEIDMSEGKNVKLGRLREALNQNDKNVPWDPSMLAQASSVMFKGHLKHSPNKDDPQAPFSEISRVTKA